MASNQAFKYISSKIVSKKSITSMYDYDDGIYKQIKCKAIIYKFADHDQEVYAEQEWDFLKPGDELEAILDRANIGSLGEKDWLVYAKNKQTNQVHGRTDKPIPWTSIVVAIVLLLVNLYGLIFDFAQNVHSEMFLFKWAFINLVGVGLLSLSLNVFKQGSVDYIRFFRLHFNKQQKNAQKRPSILSKAIVHAPLMYIFYFGGFLLTSTMFDQEGPMTNKPEMVHSLRNNRLLVVAKNEAYYRLQDEHGFSSRHYLFQGFSFHLLDGQTGETIHAVSWHRQKYEKNASLPQISEQNRDPENYTVALTKDDQILILFHPKTSGNGLASAYVARFQVDKDHITPLEALDLQTMHFETTSLQESMRQTNPYAVLKNEFNEKRYLMFSTGEIAQQLNKKTLAPDNTSSNRQMESLFFFCPKEEGSTRATAYFMTCFLPTADQRFGYEKSSAGVRIKQHYLASFAGFSSPYGASKKTLFSLAGVEKEMQSVKNPESLQPIKALSGQAVLFVEPNVLHFSDTNLVFISKEKQESYLNYTNTEKLIWSKPLKESFAIDLTKAGLAAFEFIQIKEPYLYLLVKGQRLLCVSSQTGALVWAFGAD